MWTNEEVIPLSTVCGLLVLFGDEAMDESMKKPVMIGIIVVCLGVAAYLTLGDGGGGGGS